MAETFAEFKVVIPVELPEIANPEIGAALTEMVTSPVPVSAPVLDRVTPVPGKSLVITAKPEAEVFNRERVTVPANTSLLASMNV